MGLAAPPGDGAVQLAMNNLTSASHNLIVESESTPSGLSSTGAIQVAVGETLSPETELASVSSLNENSNMAPPIAAAIESVMVSGSISSNSLVVIPGGAGDMILPDLLLSVWDSVKFRGILTLLAGSTLKLSRTLTAADG